MSADRRNEIIHVLLFNGEGGEEIKRNVVADNLVHAEDLVLHLARNLGISPIFWHLYSLSQVIDGGQLWLCPNQLLLDWMRDEPSRHLQFRLRFKPDSLDRLKENMPCFDYYFYQIRYDFLNGKYEKGLKEKVLGLVVTDVLQHLLSLGHLELPRLLDEAFKLEWRKFLPPQYQEVCRELMTYKKKMFRQHLENAFLHSQKNVHYVRQQFMTEISGPQRSELLPNYHVESYRGRLSLENSKEVLIEFQTYNNDNCLVVRPTIDQQRGTWTRVCSIQELCFITFKRTEMEVEISRKNGIPLYLKFDNERDLKSFVSLLDGYYRLAEKWSFYLCNEISSPHLARLKHNKCHGPVTDSFARKKLLEKSNDTVGVYLLREHPEFYDEIYCDMLVAPREVKPCRIERTRPDGGYLTNLDQKIYHSLDELLKQLQPSSNAGIRVGLSTCLPPGEFDYPENLLLCRNLGRDANHGADSSGHLNSSKLPDVIPSERLNFRTSAQPANANYANANGAVYLGKFNARYKVRKALFNKDSVIVKEVVNDEDIKPFLKTMAKWFPAKSECIVNLIGVSLYAPLALVMEDLPYGALDVFLEQHQKELKVVDLIEAATYFSSALWFLDEHGLVHGLIRCRNLLVSSFTPNCLKVKLGDPLGVCDIDRDRAWMAPELMTRALYQATAASDVWAFGTTLWELFSYGSRPSSDEVEFLHQPIACPAEMWALVQQCWHTNHLYRIQPQSIVRDIRNIFYEIYNSRHINCYSTLYEGKEHKENKHFIRSILNKSMSSLSLARSSLTSTTTLFTRESGSLISLACTDDPDPTEPVVHESWLIEANQLRFGNTLGKGCYGEVIKAVMTKWAGLKNENVAVKRINPDIGLPNETGFQDLKREIEIMKKLVHKNIVEIKGFVEDPQVMLVMEFVPLGSLKTFLRTHKNKGFGSKDRINLMRFAENIAAGMEYLEQKSIVHRDLAARNILVAAEDHVKISDFGLAQIIDPKSNYYKMQTNRGLPLRWYAPESLKTLCFSHQSDVWSYGITLWEMMTYGEDPVYPIEVKDENLLDVLEKGCRLPCPDNCPSEVMKIMRDCWQEDPQKRPSFTKLREQFESMI